MNKFFNMANGAFGHNKRHKNKDLTNRFICLGFASFIALSISNDAFADGRRAEIVVDADSGVVLHEENATQKRYPASITKVMTLYLLFDAIDKGQTSLDDKVIFSRNASNQSPTKLGINAGSSISVETAIQALIIRSANDVAVAVAEKIGGSESNFASLMTQKAHELGMNDTNFANASGLPNRKNISTAEDLAKLAIAIRRDFPRQYHWFANESMEFRGKSMHNHNHLVGKVNGVDGLKTGFTRDSGYNLATSSIRDGRRLVTVVMGGSSWRERDANVESLIEASYQKIGVSRSAQNIQQQFSYLSDKDQADTMALVSYNNISSQNNNFNTNFSPLRFVQNSQTNHIKHVEDKSLTPIYDEVESEENTPSNIAPKINSNVILAANVATVPAIKIMPPPSQIIIEPKTELLSLSPSIAPPSITQIPQKDEVSTINIAAEAPNIPQFTVPEVKEDAIISIAENASKNNDEYIAKLREEAEERQKQLLAQISQEEEQRRAKQIADDAERREKQQKLLAQKRERKLAEEKATKDKTMVELQAKSERAKALKSENSRQLALASQRGNIIVQVGAFKEKGDAQDTLEKLSRHFPSFASKQVTTFSDTRGTWFRARIGGIGVDAANLACKAVKTSGGNCNIVR